MVQNVKHGESSLRGELSCRCGEVCEIFTSATIIYTYYYYYYYCGEVCEIFTGSRCC